MAYRYSAGRAQPSRGFLPPPRTDGYLYYVRLRTEIGLIYKLGFTTLASVEERLAFKGEGAEKLIEKVLLFHYFANAWELEQELHSLFDQDKLFSCGSWIAMPLYKNGQSELYGDDILRFDHGYSEQQLQDVQDNIVILDVTRNGQRDAREVRAEIAARRANEKARAEARAKSKATAERYQPGLGMRALSLVVKPVFMLLTWSVRSLFGNPGLRNPIVPVRNVKRIEELRLELHEIGRMQRGALLVSSE